MKLSYRFTVIQAINYPANLCKQNYREANPGFEKIIYSVNLKGLFQFSNETLI